MDAEKLKNLSQSILKNINKKQLDFYKNLAPELTPELKKQIAVLSKAAIKAHPLRRTSQAKTQNDSPIKKTRQHPMPVFLLTVFQTLTDKNPYKKITTKSVRREIELNSENYLNEYFLDVKIESDYFELLTSKNNKPTRFAELKWSSLSSTLTDIREKVRASDKNLTLRTKIKR